MRCTQATLEALGIKGESPKTGAGVIQVLQASGVRLDWSLVTTLPPRTTVREFVSAYPKGRYYLSTRGHAMALVDGVLTDTTGRGIDGRWVEAAVGIKK